MSLQRKPKTPKRLFRDLLDQNPTSRPPFIPLVYRYASKVSQIPADAMVRNPNQLSNSLIMAQQLFGYDGIISSYDLALETEAFGWEVFQPSTDSERQKEAARSLIASGKLGEALAGHLRPPLDRGRISTVQEATSQLCEIAGREVPVIGVVNSPVTLLNRALGGELVQLWREHHEQLADPMNRLRDCVLEFIKAYCERRVDAIWLVEEDWSGMGAEDIEWLRSFYNTFWNVTQYYDVKAIIAIHAYDPGQLESYFTMGADGIFLGNLGSLEIPLPSLMEWGERYGVSVGLPCPYPESPDPTRQLDSLVSSACDAGRGLFLSTPWEVPLETPADWIHNMVSMVKGED